MAHEESSIVPFLVIGGIGYYLYSSGFFSSLFGSSTAPPTISAPLAPGAPGVTIAPTTPAVPPVVAAAIQCGVNQVLSADGKSCQPVPVGTSKVINGVTWQWDGKQWNQLVSAVTCPPGFLSVNGQCIDQSPSNPQNLPISQRMTNLSNASLQTMDGWCYYYTQLTGLQCPRDPGEILAAAGPNPPSFPQGRDTLIDVGTWLAFMNQNGAGISGLGNLAGLGCECQNKDKTLGGIKGLGLILDFNNFFSLQPKRRHLTGNFR